ncbi:MAG: hypothetical protein JWP78_2062 [Mucilaginibacter sp.]|nr:hypothetical protein [Mucilaginibacter sp.]
MKNSSFAGFLDGYRSNNIASIETVMNYKIDDISDLLGGLLELINDQPEIKNILNRNVSILKQKHSDDIINVLISFGETLKTNISVFNKLSENLDGAAKEKLRQIIYIFVELAKMSEDRRLINIALDLGSDFNY